MQTNSVGRKYQHVEDLLLTHGAVGGLHAVERLVHIARDPSTLEIKWDGNPVIFWGKQHGQFTMMTKNAWDYYKRGSRMLADGTPVVPTRAKDLQDFILNTGKISDERIAYAKALSSLWPLMEEVSPDNGFFEGSFLFSPMAPKEVETNVFKFQPNITRFEVEMESLTGQRIENATAMISATGFYNSIGSFIEKRPEYTKSSNQVIVQGPVTSTAPGIIQPNITDTELDLLKDAMTVTEYIKKNADAIDTFLNSKPFMKTPGEIVYTFLNAVHRKEYIIHLFKGWANENLSERRRAVLYKHQHDLVVLLRSIEKITALKHKVMSRINQDELTDIKMVNPEGYVQPHPNVEFRYDIPDQFIKLINQEKWAPRK